MSITINFDRSYINEILDIFDKEIDQEGRIVEKESQEPVVTQDGENVKHRDLGLIARGSEVFVEDNFVSMLEFAKRQD